MQLGIFQPSFWEMLGIILLTTHITIISVTLYLHRYSAHRAIDLHPSLKYFFRIWLWLTTGTVTKEWTAIHRKHHAKCETTEDPHSPQVYGIRTLLLRGAGLYRKEAKNQQTLDQYGKGTPDDWLENTIFKYDYLGIIITLCFNIIMLGPLGILLWAVQMLWIPLFAAGVINGVGHFWGYRNYESPDASKNIFPLGILIGGEELHNNHHVYPNSAKLSLKWWELDIGWVYIRLLSWVKLAKVNRVPPKMHTLKDKLEADFDTLKAILGNRYQIMAQYRKKVILPLVATEQAKALPELRKPFRSAKKLLGRETTFFDQKKLDQLQELLRNNSQLSKIYEFKVRLQEDIWQRAHQNKKDMLEALSQWCKEAEASGIQALEEFAQLLKSYTWKPAHTS